MSAGWMRVARPSTLDAAQVVGLAVVDDDPAPEGARPIGTKEALELVAPRSPCEAPCDEHGDPLARDPGPSELVEHGGQRLTTRIVLRGRKRQLRRLYDDGRAAAGRSYGPERLTRERVAKGLDDGCLDVGDRVERRRRDEQDRVVGDRDDREARAGVERDAWHRRASIGRVHASPRDLRRPSRESRGTAGRRSGGTRVAARPATRGGWSCASR